MNKAKAESLKKYVQEVERSMGLRKFGDCPICDDALYEENGIKKCVYCDWNSDWTAKKTAERYNNYWKKGNVKEGYEREPKKPEDFMVKKQK